jgi:hypothetical protein
MGASLRRKALRKRGEKRCGEEKMEDMGRKEEVDKGEEEGCGEEREEGDDRGTLKMREGEGTKGDEGKVSEGMLNHCLHRYRVVSMLFCICMSTKRSCYRQVACISHVLHIFVLFMH